QAHHDLRYQQRDRQYRGDGRVLARAAACHGVGRKEGGDRRQKRGEHRDQRAGPCRPDELLVLQNGTEPAQRRSLEPGGKAGCTIERGKDDEAHRPEQKYIDEQKVTSADPGQGWMSAHGRIIRLNSLLSATITTSISASRTTALAAASGLL